MPIGWRAALASLEAVTGLCAALNLAYFVHRAISVDSPSRRAAALVLALISLGTFLEGLVLIASLEVAGQPGVPPAAWVAARTMTLAGSGFISALILKAMGRGK